MGCSLAVFEKISALAILGVEEVIVGNSWPQRGLWLKCDVSADLQNRCKKVFFVKMPAQDTCAVPTDWKVSLV